MGLAVLPARLKRERLILGEAIVEGKDIRVIVEINKLFHSVYLLFSVFIIND